MISDYIRNNSYAIVAGYRNGDIVAALGGIIYRDALVEIVFPKVNPFELNQKISFHLDNRTGIEEFDADLKVYRASVKGRVVGRTDKSINVEIEEYELKYSYRIVESFKAAGYSYPADDRKTVRLKEAVFSEAIAPNIRESENKLGVLITKAAERPHTTVMAFLSSGEDDIFIISHEDSFKSKSINRDEDCVFAIDHRAQYKFEKAIDWNYTLVKGRFRSVGRGNAMFGKIQAMFVDKNPWEYLFFTDSKIEMYYIEPVEIMCPEKLG